MDMLTVLASLTRHEQVAFMVGCASRADRIQPGATDRHRICATLAAVRAGDAGPAEVDALDVRIRRVVDSATRGWELTERLYLAKFAVQLAQGSAPDLDLLDGPDDDLWWITEVEEILEWADDDEQQVRWEELGRLVAPSEPTVFAALAPTWDGDPDELLSTVARTAV